MKSIWIAAIAAGLCLASLATGNAQTTVDINGQNSWSDASGGSTPTLVTGAPTTLRRRRLPAFNPADSSWMRSTAIHCASPK